VTTTPFAVELTKGCRNTYPSASPGWVELRGCTRHVENVSHIRTEQGE